MTKKKEWTLMFYLASDNPLAPGVISQLKAIKAAGFHQDANVIMLFDPQTEGTPTHVFDVNGWRRAGTNEPDVGFKSGPESWVYNVLEDKLWGEEKDRNNEKIRDRLKKKYKDEDIHYDPPPPPALKAETDPETSPKESLEAFLNLCATSYPADHYMLFILGHGLVVGTQVFLYDEHAQEHSLELTDLRKALETFNNNSGGTLELVSFHSCSVSSLEVAYELKDCASYMLASQGTAFIGSWPYRQILIRIFNKIEKDPTPAKIRHMLGNIFDYCVHNSTDFLLAGYPFQVCLCDLKKISETREAIRRLSDTLINSLAGDPSSLKFPEFADSILLAHWKSQSFHQEMYTDISDFCRCLHVRTTQPAADAGAEAIRKDIQKACIDVVGAVKTSVVRAAFAGPEYQYSKGLSIYFPWSRPIADLWDTYTHHEFNNAETGVSWANFLDTYFVKTMRDPITKEREHFIEALGENGVKPASSEAERLDAELLQDQMAYVYTQAPLQLNQGVAGSLKVDKGDPLGGCSCPSIKNYPLDTRGRTKRGTKLRDQANDVYFGVTSQDES